MSALNTSVVEMVKSIKKGEITSEELVKNYIKEIKKKEKDVEAWEFFDEELAISLLNRLRFNGDRIVTIDSILADKRKKRIVMDFASLMDDSHVA